jgi:hypothetical protein
MTLITIAIYEHETTASIVETRLAFEGIKCRVFKNFGFRSTWKKDLFQKTGYEIQVLESDVKEAIKVIELFEQK